jgi:hypothetical protein
VLIRGFSHFSLGALVTLSGTLDSMALRACIKTPTGTPRG